MNIKLILILLVGTCFHIWAFSFNEILKVADSFAYLQMSHFITQFSQEGFGSGWFGFLYSLCIALGEILIQNSFLAAKIVNIILFNISALLIYKISQPYLRENFRFFVVILMFLSPTLLHFNIHILSENIYIPLFLGLVYILEKFVLQTHQLSPSIFLQQTQMKLVIIIGILLALMYLTRAEAFIYILSIGIISVGLLYQKKLSPTSFCKLGGVFFLSFFLVISPYLYHLHNVTGEWGLTNKGASNLRQAQLRGIEKMDDAGFEQAVAELTADKKHLIAGFAGGMKYDTPSIEGSLGSSISENPHAFIARMVTNQIKLFTKNLPEIFIGTAPKLFVSEDKRFQGNYVFLIFCIIPLLVLMYGILCMYKKHKIFIVIVGSFFLPALLFFTIFFTLNRYFLIFLPLLFIIFAYAIQKIADSKNLFLRKYISIILTGNILCVLLLSVSVYINTEKTKDEYYELKKRVGIWLHNYIAENMPEKNTSITKKTFNNTVNILERFPIVTYYAGSTNRWITPYESQTQHFLTYANYNNIDFLVVDTMDFLTYRPTLASFLEETPKGMKKIQEFHNTKNQKVILYQFEKEYTLED